MKICFFAPVPDKQMLDRVEFYRQDIDILKSLGGDLVISTKWNEIPRDADLYFVWWWTWAFMPLVKAKLAGKPLIITGSFDHPLPQGGWEFDRRPLLHKWLIRWALRQADANVFVSRLEHERIPGKLRVNRPVYIPHIVDESVYQATDGAEEDFVMTIAWMENGNSTRKCIPEIIRAAKLVVDQHPRVRFVIAGERGSDCEKLSALASSLGVRSSMVDARSPESIAQGIIKVLNNDAYRAKLRRDGVERARSVFPFARRKDEIEALIRSIVK